MEVKQAGKDIIIKNADCFNLIHTFECGQCFRWNIQPDGSYIGVAFEKVLHISQHGNTITLHNTTMEDYLNLWYNYFDLGRDYPSIQRRLSSDSVLKNAISCGSGIRILAQEPFETLLSFIISANNNIPRIKLIIEKLCEKFGKELSYAGKTYYSFPSAQTLAGLGVSDLAPLKAGFRDKYLVDAINKVNSGEIELEPLKAASFKTAKSELLKIKGVGEKVANCIVLFGLGHYGAFPVDVWIKRIVNHYYFNDNDGADIYAFADEKFGELGGFAQQYLFYYARKNKLAK